MSGQDYLSRGRVCLIQHYVKRLELMVNLSLSGAHVCFRGLVTAKLCSVEYGVGSAYLQLHAAINR
jgi:hypothetical protein